MAVDVPAIREVVERVFTRKDVLDACKRRDLAAVITVLGAQGVTQGQLSMLTGIPQGRLSEYKNRKRTPTATSTFEAFADGLGMPPTARRAPGLDPTSTSAESCPGKIRVAEMGDHSRCAVQWSPTGDARNRES
jgi:transcriptional regulator with XRE-family HTH domain